MFYQAPLTIDDKIDYYLISLEQDQRLGFFILPKQILIGRRILSTAQKEGKRMFCVYKN
ncbi:hypothetical protein D7322_23890 [Sphingobacterium puteale]|uniref:Uncharacterized protein n=1 Tax=Sphingobacterium puteale TaxID=2420510 RepID=A0A420VRP1_9SPHI|nr:hypothetical protein D7322_23890 [Sphingobacterium puteale]